MSVRIRKVEIVDADAERVGMLLESVAVGKDRFEDVAKDLAEGRAALWYLDAPRMKGVMVTVVVGDLLFVWHLAGRGLWRYSRSIFRAVQEIALRNGLKGIQGQATPTLVKLYTRMGFTAPRAVVEWRA